MPGSGIPGMAKRTVAFALLLVCLLLTSGKIIGQLNVPKSGGPASIRDVQGEVPPRSTPVPSTDGNISVTSKWMASQNETLLDSIRLLLNAASPDAFRKYQEDERARTAGKDQSLILDYRNKSLHELVKGAVTK